MRTRSSFFASLKLSRFFDGRLAKPRAGAAAVTDAPTRGGRAGSSRRDGGAQSGDSGAAQAARLRAQLRRQQAVLPLIIVGEGRRSATRAAVVYRAATAVSSAARATRSTHMAPSVEIASMMPCPTSDSVPAVAAQS